MSKRYIWFAVAAITAAAALLYFFLDPQECSLFPKCIFYELTGLYCPGCGGQRAVHQLLNGDIMSALGYNPFVTLFLPYLVLFIILSVVGFCSSGKLSIRLKRWISIFYGKAVLVIILVIAVIFFIFRNL